MCKVWRMHIVPVMSLKTYHSIQVLIVQAKCRSCEGLTLWVLRSDWCIVAPAKPLNISVLISLHLPMCQTCVTLIKNPRKSCKWKCSNVPFALLGKRQLEKEFRGEITHSDDSWSSISLRIFTYFVSQFGTPNMSKISFLFFRVMTFVGKAFPF